MCVREGGKRLVEGGGFCVWSGIGIFWCFFILCSVQFFVLVDINYLFVLCEYSFLLLLFFLC